MATIRYTHITVILRFETAQKRETFMQVSFRPEYPRRCHYRFMDESVKPNDGNTKLNASLRVSCVYRRLHVRVCSC